MKNLEFLVREARRKTNTLDPSAISNIEVASYFDDAQKYIQSLIIHGGNASEVFSKSVAYELTPGVNAYNLPPDCHAWSSISSVHLMNGNRILSTLRRVDYRERSSRYGYSILGKQLILSTDPSLGLSRQLLVIYNAANNPLSVPVGTLTTITGSEFDTTVIEKEFWLEDHRITAETADGLKTYELLSYDTVNNRIDLGAAALAEITLPSKIYLGDLATNVVSMPEEVKPYMMRYVQVRILDRRKSTKVSDAEVFSNTEKEQLVEIFSKVSTDIKYPITSDSDFLGI